MSNGSYRAILWSSVLGTLALVVIGMVWLAQGGGQPEPGPAAGVAEILPDDHVIGNREASVKLVEYSDFQCPGCAQIYPFVTLLAQEYGDRLGVVYRNFPIPGHKNGLPAAYAAGAAGEQGKFFEMAGLLFANQGEWANLEGPALIQKFDSYAQSLGLDLTKFYADQGSEAVKAKVEKDFRSGEQAGVNQTPSFFLNGKYIELQSYDDFRNAIDAALAS